MQTNYRTLSIRGRTSNTGRTPDSGQDAGHVSLLKRKMENLEYRTHPFSADRTAVKTCVYWHEQRTQLKTLGSAVISTSYMSHSLPNRRSTGSGPEWICPKCLYPSAKSKNLSWKQTKTSLPVVCKDPIWLPYDSQPITLQAFFDVISNYREHSRDICESLNDAYAA